MKVHFELVVRSTSLAISLAKRLRINTHSSTYKIVTYEIKMQFAVISFALICITCCEFSFTFLYYLIIHFVPTKDANSSLIARRGGVGGRWRLTQSQTNKLISKKAITWPALWLRLVIHSDWRKEGSANWNLLFKLATQIYGSSEAD